jgi:hypothetical protein
VQYSNAANPILVTLLGMVMLVRPWQIKNAPVPMLVTLLGMVTSVRLIPLDRRYNLPTGELLVAYSSWFRYVLPHERHA